MSDSESDASGGGEITREAPVVGYQPDRALAAFAEGMRAVEGNIVRLVQPLSEAQVNWRPTDGRWSIAECVAHLTATGRAYVAPIEMAVERGFRRGYLGGREFQPGRIGWRRISQMEPPPTRRMQAPRKLV